MKNLSHFKLFRSFPDGIILFSYCGLIYLLSAQSKLATPFWFNHQDKLIHFAAYALMALWCWRFFRHFLNKIQHLIIVTALFCSFYGLTDEWHQSFVPGRNADSADWLADTCGALFMIAILYQLQLKFCLFKSLGQ